MYLDDRDNKIIGTVGAAVGCLMTIGGYMALRKLDVLTSDE